MTGEHPADHPETGVYGRPYVQLPTAAESAAADRTAHEQFGVPERVLMESAGRAAALVLSRLYPVGRIVGVAGSGHNGGDLLVMLRTLRAWGRDVLLIAAGSRPPDNTLSHGDPIDIVSADAADDALAGAAVIVDGLLGTGFEGAPRGRIAEWIGRINRAGRPVLSLDVPSGADPTTGAIRTEAVRADVTVTFGWPKLGLMLHPARTCCGRIVAVEIGFPADCLDTHSQLITSGFVRTHYRTRDPAAHKGSAGRVLVLAGQEGMAGAAAIAARAAIRAGAGLVRIASAPENRVVLQTLVPAATFLDRAHVTRDDTEPMHALVAGPGLGTDEAAQAALTRALDLMADRPTLLDADALNILAREPDRIRAVGGSRELIITPHVRELARITHARLDEILADAPAAARAAARELNCIVLLKGQPSVIATPDGELLVNTVGSSDVATAGMGDQLSGTIGALLAAGHDALDAAALGLYLSGRAADLAALGTSLSPDDVSEHLARAIRDPGPVASPLGLPFITFDQPARR